MIAHTREIKCYRREYTDIEKGQNHKCHVDSTGEVSKCVRKRWV